MLEKIDFLNQRLLWNKVSVLEILRMLEDINKMYIKLTKYLHIRKER